MGKQCPCTTPEEWCPSQNLTFSVGEKQCLMIYPGPLIPSEVQPRGVGPSWVSTSARTRSFPDFIRSLRRVGTGMLENRGPQRERLVPRRLPRGQRRSTRALCPVIVQCPGPPQLSSSSPGAPELHTLMATFSLGGSVWLLPVVWQGGGPPVCVVLPCDLRPWCGRAGRQVGLGREQAVPGQITGHN